MTGRATPDRVADPLGSALRVIAVELGADPEMPHESRCTLCQRAYSQAFDIVQALERAGLLVAATRS